LPCQSYLAGPGARTGTTSADPSSFPATSLTPSARPLKVRTAASTGAAHPRALLRPVGCPASLIRFSPGFASVRSFPSPWASAGEGDRGRPRALGGVVARPPLDRTPSRRRDGRPAGHSRREVSFRRLQEVHCKAPTVPPTSETALTAPVI